MHFSPVNICVGSRADLATPAPAYQRSVLLQSFNACRFNLETICADERCAAACFSIRQIPLVVFVAYVGSSTLWRSGWKVSQSGVAPLFLQFRPFFVKSLVFIRWPIASCTAHNSNKLIISDPEWVC
jgi:hypothetical protein